MLKSGWTGNDRRRLNRLVIMMRTKLSTKIVVSCPPLPSENFDGSLVVSGTSRGIGNIVEFSCTGADDILWGSTVLQCSETGQWNGSIPTCIHRDDITSLSSISTPVSTLTTTQAEGPAEFKVDTVVIFLWITGGLLLITLSVLIGCVLKNHKKRQQNRNGTPSGNGQGSPRHGGVNPTFTNYDEIWTWIPVVTNNNENCRSQENSASARESSTQRANTELMRSLRLPTYSEAVNSATNNVRNPSNPSQNRHLPPHVTNQRHTNQTNVVSVHNITNNNAVSVSRDVRRNTNSEVESTAGARERNGPCEQISSPSCSQINRNNVTQINVSRGGSALQQARDFINQISAHPQRPQPTAPVYVQSSNLVRDARFSGTRESSSGNVRPSTSANMPVPSVHSSHRYRASSTQQCVRPTDFSHSDRSVFMRYNGNERNGVRTYEQPPPYSEFRSDVSISRSHGVASVSGLLTSHTSAVSSEVALRTGIASQYF